MIRAKEIPRGPTLKGRLFWRFVPWDSWLHRYIRMRRRKHTDDFWRQMMIGSYATRWGLRVFVETGTYLGDMLDAVKDHFDILYSIELSKPLYEYASKRFRNCKKIHLHYGDSALVLAKILEEIKEPALFWLDAHPIPNYPHKRVPVVGDHIPLKDELAAIESHPIRGHVVLIDNSDIVEGKTGNLIVRL